ncbi:MAG: SUF system NifU family Fe-S cluster assembly protein [Lactobacillales bacterium]|jgi:nitrogen fixation NifU-like protein|nr:SUF system NifU family Fe-S cluster assembly protein [Lactobacillales bacterium]
MALSKLDNLYREIILDHSSHPHNHGELADANTNIEANNPTCGDVIKLTLNVDGDVVKAIKFDGHGCSISTASASMMTDLMVGKSKDEAYALIDDFLEVVKGGEGKIEDGLGDAEILSGVAKFPARIKCATLAWKALEQALFTEKDVEINHQPHSADDFGDE